MAASLLAATVVTAILRCDFCAAKLRKFASTCTRRPTRPKQICIPPPLKMIEFIFGSLRNFHVVHSASRNDAWKKASGLPPPQPKIPPPRRRRGLLWTWRVFLQKEHGNSRRPQNWCSHFRPQNSREKLYMPPPLSHFWPKGIFQERGVGVYILRPHAVGILHASPFYTSPTPRRVFQGLGGGGGV